MVVSFYTLGCKLNQGETEALADAFSKEGFTVEPLKVSAEVSGNFRQDPNGREPRSLVELQSSEPKLCIINTCTVTSKADQKVRRIIRLCLYKGFIVIVTGCYAERAEEALKTLEEQTALKGEKKGFLFVFPGQSKGKLLDLPGFLKGTLRQAGSEEDSGSLRELLVNFLTTQNSSKNPFSLNTLNFSFHSRSFLKIQDGCDCSCAYCIVPLVRGKSISLKAEDILERLKALEERGMAEAVLTGVNICQYQDPENPLRRLSSLIRYLLDNTKKIKLRLSSIEPGPGFNTSSFFGKKEDDFFEILSHERIRNHFHLSVQSGSDAVLEAMGRPYTSEEILWMAEKLRTIRDDPFLACDIIAGFPGETREDFEKTIRLCKTAGFAWIHVFPFSKRPGTRAASIKKDLVSEKDKKERVKIIGELAKNGRNAYIRRWQGRIVEAVAEVPAALEKSGPRERSDFFPFFPALTDNYLKVCISLGSNGKRVLPGTAFKCRIGKLASNKESGFDALADILI